MFEKYKPIILEDKHYIRVLNDLLDALIEDGKIIEEIGPCSLNEKCNLKRKLMEFYIDNPAIFP